MRKFKSYIFTLPLLFVFANTFASTEINVNTEDKSPTNPNVGVASNRPWWLGDLLTIVGIFVGAAGIMWQLSRHHNNELRIQKENYREQLRLEIYQEFSKVLTDANEKSSDVGMYAFLIPSNFELYIHLFNNGIKPTPLAKRSNEINNRHDAASRSYVNLIRLIEKYEIVKPELEIFKVAINVASYDMRETFTPLFQFLLRILPVDIVDEGGNPQIVNVICPNQEQMNELSNLVDAFKQAEDIMGNYLFDLNVELQELFLGSLFDSKPKKRKPLNPIFKVVTTEPAEMRGLEKYFHEETAWGRSVKRAEEDVKKGLIES